MGDLYCPSLRWLLPVLSFAETEKVHAVRSHVVCCFLCLFKAVLIDISWLQGAVKMWAEDAFCDASTPFPTYTITKVAKKLLRQKTREGSEESPFLPWSWSPEPQHTIRNRPYRWQEKTYLEIVLWVTTRLLTALLHWRKLTAQFLCYYAVKNFNISYSWQVKRAHPQHAPRDNKIKNCIQTFWKCFQSVAK